MPALLPRTAHILITSCMSWRRCLRNLLQNVKITYDLSCVSSHLMEFEAQAKWSHFEMGITNFCYLSLQMLSRCLIFFFLSFWCDHEKSCWWFTIKITKVHFICLFCNKYNSNFFIRVCTRMLNFTPINKTFWSSWYYINNLITQR